jgi:redox-sensitive bicupin YhaK (pirin superfamily)
MTQTSMSQTTTQTPTPVGAISPPTTQQHRRIAHRTRGRRHGPIVRLMSPSDLGEIAKPFVFLDLFEADMRLMRDAMALHPHSGIATVTVFTKGDVRFEDPQAGEGTITYGGVEWLRAGGGVWHGKELSPGASSHAQGFQLWLALPPELENAPSESQYIEADAMNSVGPARVIVGAYDGVTSAVRAPAGVNYLLVTLTPGETWTYRPPPGHSVGWLAMAQGVLDAGERVSAGEMVVFEHSEKPIVLTAGGETDTVFVLGSAIPHPHALHLGHYSVHTSAEALARGEQRIAELGRGLAAAGDRRTRSGSTPVYR